MPFVLQKTLSAFMGSTRALRGRSYFREKMKMRKLVFASFVAMAALTATAQASDTWLICAKEGSTCIVPNTSTAIYYGNNGRYASTVGVTSIKCNNDSFDGDPLKGKDKVCMYDMGDPGSKSWTQCAEEGKDCSFSGYVHNQY